MLGTSSKTATVEDVIGMACAQNAPAEVHYQSKDGIVIMGRVRLLELTPHHVLADRPLYLDGDRAIPDGAAVTVHVILKRSGHQFASVLEESDRTVRLNARQTVPGIALKRPTKLAESQRRLCLRVSMAGYDPISVHLVRPHAKIPDACAIDAVVSAGWIVDLSVSGAAILLDRRVMARARGKERFFLTFTLPEVEEPFYMLGTVRHSRIVESSDSLRLGLCFRPWRRQSFLRDQKRLSRFIADHERRMLRRRK